MKVLLAPLGSRGDVQPQLVLGQELARRGHAVTLAAPPDFSDLATHYGLPFVPIGEPIMPLLQRNSDMTERHPAIALPSQIKLVRRYIVDQVGDLLARSLTPDIIVAAGISFAGKVLADKLRVPHVYCHYTVAALRSAHHPPAVIPIFDQPRFANDIMWRSLTTLFDLTLGSTYNQLRKRVGLAAHTRSWVEIHGTEALLAQDAVMGKVPPDVPGHTVHVPALVPRSESERPLPDLLERFLRGAADGSAPASPVVYLGFGSMPTVDRSRIAQIACDLFEQHGVRVVLFSAHAEDSQSSLPPGVFACSDADHALLFPRVDLIVHHGGAGTTAAALRSGVPQLIVPHIVDQFFHGRRIAELGVGPAPVPKPKLTSAAIASALASRFQYWANAQAVRASIHSEGGAKQAADHLESLARL